MYFSFLFSFCFFTIQIYQFIRDCYAPRFPELETLIPNPIEYAKAVKAIGNTTDLTSLDLRSILPLSIVMIVTVTATTTSGKPLPEDKIQKISEACDMLFELDLSKFKVKKNI